MVTDMTIELLIASPFQDATGKEIKIMIGVHEE
jgi:chemotaxis regulatin CheY-phosphate phosphatase CheZ